MRRVLVLRREPSRFSVHTFPNNTKKSTSDDEEDDDCAIDAADSHNKPSGNLSPLVTDDKRSQSTANEGTAGRRKVLSVNQVADTPGQEPTPPAQNVSHGERLDMEDIPWYWQVFNHVMRLSIDPDGLLYFYWKALLSMAVMYNYVIIILRIAFEDMRNEPLFSHLDMVCDLMYLIDFVVESKCCYLSNGSLITDSRLTLQNYLGKSSLVMDIATVVPVRMLIATTAGLCNIFGAPISLLQEHYWLIEPTFRLNRLAKSHVMSSFFNKTESRTNSPNLLRAVRLGVQLALVIHWMACLYYMISEYEGLGSSEWAYPSGTEYSSFQRKYIVCMYWSIMTLTTIGERPSPVTSLEYIFTGLTFLIGVFVFAAVVGNVGDVISNMNAARRDFQNRMDQIKFYLNHRQVPEVLQTRIKTWAEYTWDRTKAVDEPSVLQWLPERLRTEVAIYVHLSVLKKVSIFDECEEGLLRELVLKLKPQIYSPGDYICRLGEIGREMYIINHGQVEILFPDVDTGAMRQVAVMNPGNFFGEISLLKLDDGQNKRTADVRSIGFSELLCLSRRDLMVALTEYPDAKRILEEYARERFRQTKQQSQSRGESPSSSPRESVVSTPNSPISAKQAFARVMRKEGFASLLKRKDTDLMAIKSAVEELKATNSSEVHHSFVSLHKEIQDMGRQLMQKDVEMQQAKAEISYLKSIISLRFHAPGTPNGIPDGTHLYHSDEGLVNSQLSPDKNGINIANSRIESPFSDDSGRFRRQFYMNQDESPLHNSSEMHDTHNNYYKISFLGNSQDVLEINYETKDADKSVGVEDSSFQSSDDDSCDEDLESLEEKFDSIGKEGLYFNDNVSNMSNKRSVSLNMLSDMGNQQQNYQNGKFQLHRNASFHKSPSTNLITPTQLSPVTSTQCAPDISTQETPDTSILRAPDIPTQRAPVISTQCAPDISTQQTPDTSILRAPDIYTQRAPVTSTQCAPDISTQQTPDTSILRAPDISTQRAPVTSTQQTPDISTQQTPDTSILRAPDISTQRAPVTSTQRTPDISTQQTPNTSILRAPDRSTQRAPDISTYHTPDTSILRAPDISTHRAHDTSTQLTHDTSTRFNTSTSNNFVDKACKNNVS